MYLLKESPIKYRRIIWLKIYHRKSNKKDMLIVGTSFHFHLNAMYRDI